MVLADSLVTPRAYIKIALSIAIGLLANFICPQSTKIASQSLLQLRVFSEIMSNWTPLLLTRNRSAINAVYFFIAAYTTL